MNVFNRWKNNIFLLGLIILILLAACTPQTPDSTPEPSDTETATVVTAEPELTEPPEDTPSIPSVILVTGSEADTDVETQVQTVLESLAADSEMAFLQEQSISQDQLTPDTRVVVTVGSDLDITSLAAAAPEVVFVVMDQPGVTPTQNITVIGDPVTDQRNQSFLAGYLAALISSDYKVGALVPSDSDLGEVIAEAFILGAEFFCGVCNPLYPPYNNFPQTEALSMANPQDGFQTAVDTLKLGGVEVLYIPGELASSEILDYVDEQGMIVVGDAGPAMPHQNWAGTVTLNPSDALKEIWQDLLTGASGTQVPGTITLTNRNAGLISDGRLRLFEETTADLAAGLILPERMP